MRNPNLDVVEAYINAIKNKDLSQAPLAPDVTFEDPLTPPLKGAEAVLEFISGVLPIVNDIRIKRHIAEGDYVATMWDADTTFGVIHIFECFRVSNGLIQGIQAFLDPRPLTNPAP